LGHLGPRAPCIAESAGAVVTSLPDRLAGFKGPTGTSNGRGRERREGRRFGRAWKERGRGKDGRRWRVPQCAAHE